LLGLILASPGATASTLLRSRIAVPWPRILALQAALLVVVASAPSAMTATFLAVSAAGHFRRSDRLER
jgi:hypothetical protein